MPDSLTASDAITSSVDGPARDVVAAALAEILKVDSVDPDIGFFDLGVSSAMLVRLLHALRGRWPDLRIIDIFDHPTVEQLAGFLEPK